MSVENICQNYINVLESFERIASERKLREKYSSLPELNIPKDCALQKTQKLKYLKEIFNRVTFNYFTSEKKQKRALQKGIEQNRKRSYRSALRTLNSANQNREIALEKIISNSLIDEKEEVKLLVRENFQGYGKRFADRAFETAISMERNDAARALGLYKAAAEIYEAKKMLDDAALCYENMSVAYINLGDESDAAFECVKDACRTAKGKDARISALTRLTKAYYDYFVDDKSMEDNTSLLRQYKKELNTLKGGKKNGKN